jgi:hypothetical protein
MNQPVEAVDSVKVTVFGGTVTVCVGACTVTLVLDGLAVVVFSTRFVTVFVSELSLFPTASAIPAPAAAASSATSATTQPWPPPPRRRLPQFAQYSAPGWTGAPHFGHWFIARPSVGPSGVTGNRSARVIRLNWPFPGEVAEWLKALAC